MKFFIDNQLIQKIAQADNQELLVKACTDAGLIPLDSPIEIVFGWPSLLEYLGLGSLFENFPLFNQQSELFNLIIATLPAKSEKDFLIRLYDQVFVECLTQVKALPYIHLPFLIEQMQKKRQSLFTSPLHNLFAPSLERYEKLFLEFPSHTMHDLILYLAWDRVCVYLASVFEHDFSNVDIQPGLKVLQECLLESFQHITAHGRTAPGFFRFIETLYAYHMREEHLPTHTEQEWLTLCQSAKALRPREGLNNVFYIDAAVIHQDIKRIDQQDPVRGLTLEPAGRVKASVSLAYLMLKKLKEEMVEWQYDLRPVEVICLKTSENHLTVDSLVSFT